MSMKWQIEQWGRDRALLYPDRKVPTPLQAVVVKVSGVGSTHMTPAEGYYSTKQLNDYGQMCFEEGRDASAMLEPMTEVADRFAHSLALELECVLANRPGYYDKAMRVLSEYREAMNAIHEQHSPTHMGEPVLKELGE